jgi:uncharacterized protein (DUF736 family)
MLTRMSDPLLSTARIAQIIGAKSSTTARNLIISGKIRGHQVGNRWRATESAARDYIAASSSTQRRAQPSIH